MSRAQVIGRREEEENCLQKIKGKTFRVRYFGMTWIRINDPGW